MPDPAADRVPRRRGRTAGPAAAADARPGGCPRRPSSRPRRAARRRFRKSTVSSARPNARVLRRRTSTITSCAGAGGPGSTATRSSSWRPTWTFRARIDQPCSVSRSATRASASSPSRCAAVRFLGRAPGWPSTAGSCQPPLTWRLSRVSPPRSRWPAIAASGRRVLALLLAGTRRSPGRGSGRARRPRRPCGRPTGTRRGRA